MNLADHLAARPNDRANLFGVNVQGGHARRVDREVGARGGQDAGNDAENLAARLTGLGQSLGHDLGRDAFDFDVHLQSSDAHGRAGHFKIHVAEVIFDALNISQDGIAVLVLHQAHRDARDRSGDRHARVHEGEGRAAHRSHRSRAIRGEDFGD